MFLLFNFTILIISDFVGLVTCNHIRVLRLFIESINTPCQFHSYPCALEHLGRAKCDVCGTDGCAIMGYHAQMNINRTGTFNIPTNDKSPFCLEFKLFWKKKISVVKDQTCGIFIYCLRFCFISPDAKGRVNLFNPLTSGVIVVNFFKKLTFFLLFYRFW